MSTEAKTMKLKTVEWHVRKNHRVNSDTIQTNVCTIAKAIKLKNVKPHGEKTHKVNCDKTNGHTYRDDSGNDVVDESNGRDDDDGNKDE